MIFKNKFFMLIGLNLLYFGEARSQTLTGVNTKNPTETLDISSILRIRSLPNDGTSGIFTTLTGTESPTANQSFVALYPIVANAFGVIGQTNKSSLVSVVNSNPDDNSTKMFVIKRFSVDDWPTGHNSSLGFNTTMRVDKWEAILSNAMYQMRVIDNLPDVFLTNEYHGWEMLAETGVNGTWRIKGDIRGVKEGPAFVDVLFIRKAVVAAEARTSFKP